MRHSTDGQQQLIYEHTFGFSPVRIEGQSDNSRTLASCSETGTLSTKWALRTIKKQLTNSSIVRLASPLHSSHIPSQVAEGKSQRTTVPANLHFNIPS